MPESLDHTSFDPHRWTENVGFHPIRFVGYQAQREVFGV